MSGYEHVSTDLLFRRLVERTGGDVRISIAYDRVWVEMKMPGQRRLIRAAGGTLRGALIEAWKSIPGHVS